MSPRFTLHSVRLSVLAYAAAGGFKLDDFAAVSGWMQRFEALPCFGSPEQILPKQTTKTA